MLSRETHKFVGNILLILFVFENRNSNIPNEKYKTIIKFTQQKTPTITPSYTHPISTINTLY